MARARAQALVEFALVAPILIMLAMLVWDGGSVLRDQVILQQAARDGARVAATAYASTVFPACGPAISPVAEAVKASAVDLPGLSSTVCYPDSQTVHMQVLYVHVLITPILRGIWGDSQGLLTLQANATFYLAPAPASVVPAPPTPTVTPTPTPTASKLLVVGPASAIAGATQTVTVTAQDASGTTVRGYTGIVHFTSTDAQASLPADYRFVASDNGIHLFTNAVILKTAGAQTVTATDIGTASITDSTDPITVSAAAATRLVISQPSETVATAVMSPAVAVSVQDSFGNPVTSSAAPISVGIDTNPSSGTLSGTFTVNAVNGVATFGDLSIDRAGSGYTLATFSTGLSGATSGGFNVSVGATNKLAFTVQPTDATAGVGLNPAVQVVAQDAGGNTVTSYVGTVQFTSTDTQASLPANYTFVAGDNGTHTFTSGITLNTAGSQSVTAIDTVTSSITDTTDPITVSAASASRLSVVASTGTVTAGAPLSVSVTAQDQYGNTVPGYVGTVQFTSTDAQASLPANYTFVAGDNGTHTFTSGISLNTAGSQSVTAIDTVTGSITDTTDPIIVSAASASRLSVVASTGTVTAGAPLSVSVTAQDQYGNTVPGYVGTVQFTSTDAQASLPANYTFVAGDNGTHTFTSGVSLNTAGSQSVTATEYGHQHHCRGHQFDRRELGRGRKPELPSATQQHTGWLRDQSHGGCANPGHLRERGYQQHGVRGDCSRRGPSRRHARGDHVGERLEWHGQLYEPVDQPGWFRLHTRCLDQRPCHCRQRKLQHLGRLCQPAVLLRTAE